MNADAMLTVVRELVAAHLPAHAARPIAPLGSGVDHAVYQVGDDILVRLVRDDDRAARRARVEREARLLRAVATLSPVAVPVPRFADAEAGAMAYGRLPGVPMLSLPVEVRRRRAGQVAAQLGRVLAALHAAPVGPMEGLVGVDEREPSDWREEAVGLLARVSAALPPGPRRAARRFVEDAPPVAAFATMMPTFTHNDLGIEHVLVSADGARVLGVIDWSDAAVTDPAVDFARILRDLGPGALDAALAAYANGAVGEPALGARIRFYARCLALEDLAFGLDTGAAAYVAKSIETMRWLFPG